MLIFVHFKHFILKTVIVAGASGLIGSHLLHFLINEKDIEEIIALVRRPLDITDKKLRQKIISFDEPDTFREYINGTALFCCLGSTRKKTPDKDNYRKVDYYYPLSLAKIAAENKVSQFHLISALGADPNAKNFYSKLKGEVETEVKRLSIKSLHIYQPSLLDGNRLESRPLEKIAIKVMTIINPLLTGNLKKYRSIKAENVARAMVNQLFKDSEGLFIYPSDKIIELV